MARYVIGKTVDCSPAEAERRIVEALAAAGFGILTEIDVQATLKKKLGAEMPPYRILGACNPGFAQRAIGVEPAIGALLPCNVVIRQDAAGAVYVELMDPDAVLTLVERPEVAALAAEVRQRLEGALARV